MALRFVGGSSLGSGENTVHFTINNFPKVILSVNYNTPIKDLTTFNVLCFLSQRLRDADFQQLFPNRPIKIGILTLLTQALQQGNSKLWNESVDVPAGFFFLENLQMIFNSELSDEKMVQIYYILYLELIKKLF